MRKYLGISDKFLRISKINPRRKKTQGQNIKISQGKDFGGFNAYLGFVFSPKLFYQDSKKIRRNS